MTVKNFNYDECLHKIGEINFIVLGSRTALNNFKKHLAAGDMRKIKDQVKRGSIKKLKAREPFTVPSS